ncbi:MAG: hypothetical protein U0903_22080 [Planctomycetales bacterium]
MGYQKLQEWVDEVARLTTPHRIHWCDGSDQEIEALYRLMEDRGELTPLNPEAYPGCYLARSDIHDVARVEGQTFISTEDPQDAGPTNNWKSPLELHATLEGLFRRCMADRVMYVILSDGAPRKPDGQARCQKSPSSPYVVIICGS